MEPVPTAILMEVANGTPTPGQVGMFHYIVAEKSMVSMPLSGADEWDLRRQAPPTKE